jgi:hypothetical protein
MSKEDDYRNNASETMLLAQRASASKDKGRLLNLAESWLDLADRVHQAERRRGRPTKLHPLVREKIDRHFGR